MSTRILKRFTAFEVCHDVDASPRSSSFLMLSYAGILRSEDMNSEAVQLTTSGFVILNRCEVRKLECHYVFLLYCNLTPANVNIQNYTLSMKKKNYIQKVNVFSLLISYDIAMILYVYIFLHISILASLFHFSNYPIHLTSSHFPFFFINLQTHVQLPLGISRFLYIVSF